MRIRRIDIFENGFIRGLDTRLFNLARDQVKEPDFVNTSYLIVHPQGTLQFEAGGIPDSQFRGDGALVVEGVQSADNQHSGTHARPSGAARPPRKERAGAARGPGIR